MAPPGNCSRQISTGGTWRQDNGGTPRSLKLGVEECGWLFGSGLVDMWTGQSYKQGGAVFAEGK